MITLQAHYVYLLIVANAVMLALACFCFTRFDKRCSQIEKFWDSPTGTALSKGEQEDLHEQLRITQRLEKRVGELQRAMEILEIKTPESAQPLNAAMERSLPLENAVRMARLGASVDDLTKGCGLNIGEARLMKRLHGASRPAVGGS